MTDDMIALSRRAVASRGWRWMPGMMRLRATPPTRRDHLRMEGRVPDGGDTWDYAAWRVIPDVTDAATLGCLLALVRDAWGNPNGHIVFLGKCGSDPRGWRFEWSTTDGQFGGGIHRYSPTEAEALVAALESAP